MHNLSDRPYMTGCQLVEPPASPRERFRQRRIGFPRLVAAALDDEPHLDAAARHLERHEPELFDHCLDGGSPRCSTWNSHLRSDSFDDFGEKSRSVVLRRQTFPPFGCGWELEDLHWADESTLALLVQLANRIPQLPVVIIGTYRGGYADDNPTLVRTDAFQPRTVDARSCLPHARGISRRSENLPRGGC